jgi:hypothetical protein
MRSLLIVLILLISLLILGSVFANPITAFVQRRLPNRGCEGEQILLWGGMLLAAFVIGLLVMYLFLHHLV